MNPKPKIRPNLDHFVTKGNLSDAILANEAEIHSVKLARY